ncbi:MAG: hypothetical protein QOF89_5003 [Acidobacteriota bacterium]|jgi:RHS repeat-associated protein|nr:hypothetical protein [Acidobacteriota bacterium]
MKSLATSVLLALWGVMLVTLTLPARAAAQTPTFVEHFEAYGAPGEPPGWFDSSPGNPTNEAPGQFKTWPDPIAPANTVFGHKGASGSFTHYRAWTFDVAQGFRFEGRMLRTKTKGHMGIVFLSSFPQSQDYYLLAQDSDGGTVRLSTPGAGLLTGDLNADVTLQANVWYRFRIEAALAGGNVHVQAKVWRQDQAEPAAWPVDATDTHGGTRTGWIGLWGESPAEKYWDDLTVWNGDSQQDHDAPQVRILESGNELLNGALFNRGVVPTIQVTDASTFTSTALLDGTAFTSGSTVSAEGGHQLVVTATDAFNNTASKTVSFTIDRTPPVFVDVAPPDNTLTAAAPATISGHVSGATTLTLNGQPVPLTGAAGDTFSAAVSLAEGANSFLLTAADAAGNSAQIGRTIVRDAMPPAVTITQPPNGTVLGSRTVEVAGTATDPHLIGVTVNGAPAALSGSAWTRTVTLAEGANTITAVATDAVGNHAQAQVTVTVDTGAPVISITEGGAPLQDHALFRRAVVPVFSATDSTAVTVEGQLNGQLFASGTTVDTDGVYQLTVSATDAAGNTAARTVRFEIDRVAAQFGAIEPPDHALVGAAQVTLQGIVTGGATAVTVNGSAATLTGEAFRTSPLALAEGDNAFTLRATDAAGNAAEQVHRVERDTVAPVVTLTSPAAGALIPGATVTVTGTAVDLHLRSVEVNGVAATVGGESFTVTIPLAASETTITAVATDAAGNRGQAAVTVVHDTEPPVLRILESGAELADGSRFNRAVTPVVEITDTSTFTSTITLDGLPFVSGTRVTSDGDHLLEVRATDAAGNTATRQARFSIDTTAPVFVSVEPADGTVTAQAQVVLQVRVTGADSAMANGAVVNLVGESFTAGPFPLAEGDNLFRLAAVDAAGNRAEKTVKVVRDSTPPTVVLSQPAADALLSTPSVAVQGTASDTRLSEVKVNGVPASLTGTTWVASQVPLSEGDNTLTAVATDAAGNHAEAARHVVLDTKPPEIAITDPASGTVTPDAQVTVRGTAADPHLDRMEVNGTRATLTGGTWSLRVSLAEGANTLTAVAFDRAGNHADTAVTVHRDSTAPSVEIRQPAEGARLTATTADVSGTVSDEPGVTVTVNGRPATVTGAAFTAASVPLVDGENRLVARARDAQGNEGVHTRTVFRDGAAPSFVSIDPAAGALAVGLDTVFDLTFSEPMAAPAAGAIRLQSAAGSLGATATVSGSHLTLRPAAPLPSAAEVRVVLTAGLTDLAGNALANPQELAFTTADTGAPPAPTVAPPPAALCATELTLTGSAEPGSTVEVAGGAGNATFAVGADGAFSIAVPLVPQVINRLRLTAVDRAGNRSPEATVQVIQDCRAPQVESARRSGDVFTVVFDEPVDPATVTAAGSITLEGADGPLAGTVAVAPDGTTATFTAAQTLGTGTFRLTVTTAVKDYAGNPMAYPFTQVFGGEGAPSFLSGTVLDDATGRPLAGVRVVVLATDGVPLEAPWPEQTTGADGRFQLPVAAGTHDLTFARPGYTPAFRVVTTRSGQGTDVFDPRLTPDATATGIGAAGGTWKDGDLTLTLPQGALTAATQVAATALSEQGLPALLPYGWTPRGAVWLDLGDSPLQSPAALKLPVEAADGRTLTVAELDLPTLQWRSRGEVQVVRGKVEIAVPRGGAFAVVEADSGATAPVAPVAGQALPSSPHPAGDEVTGATVTFDPAVVLPTQTSLATVGYTLAGAPPPSGLPLTLVIEEKLTLLDGSLRRKAPYRADLVVYRADDDAPRSRFRLRPSVAASEEPLSLGTEDVTVVTYGGETVRGDVIGPNGGAAASAEGDVVEIPAGSFSDPTAVTLARRTAADLPVAIPAGAQLLGVVALDLGGRTAGADLTLKWAADSAPAAGEVGLLLALNDLGQLGQGPFLRPVALLEPAGGTWATVAIDRADLPWPGVRTGGLYAFVRLTVPVGFLRGRVIDVSGTALAGAPVRGVGLGWVQVSDGAGRYVFPAPVGSVTVSVENRATGNAVTATVEVPAAGARVDLDLALAIIGPAVQSSTPSDGAVDVPPGVNPVLTFSEPVSRTSLAAGIELVRASGNSGDAVPISFEGQGALVRVVPGSTLSPGAAYELRVGFGVRDLQGNPLTSPVAIHFTTLRILLNADIDPSRIHVVAPDAQNRAHVAGLAGAVPAHATVYVENTTSAARTTTIQAEQDGSFQMDVEATISDELLLHVLGNGNEDVVLPLTPFRTADLHGAYIGPLGGRFQTPEGLIVTVPAGAFKATTLVKAMPQAVSSVTQAPPATGFQAVYAFKLDIGGARAYKGLRVSVPAPSGANPNATYLLSRSLSYFGEPRWQLDDLGALRNGRITTEDDPATNQAITAHVAADQKKAVAQGFAPKTLQLNPREFLPGMYSPKRDPLYVWWSTVDPLDYLIFPFGPLAHFGISFGALDFAYVVTVDAALARILPEKITVPSKLGRKFPIRVRDLDTGQDLFHGEIEAPQGTGQVIELPPDTFGDKEPPFPVSGSPIRFYPLAVGAPEDKEIAPGIKLKYDGEILKITGEAGSTHPGSQIRLHGADLYTTSAADGSFSLERIAPETGKRYILVIGAEIAVEESLEIGFSEALKKDFPGIEVHLVGGSAAAIPLQIDEVRSREVVRLSPKVAWTAGQTYELRLTSALADDAGNTWDESLNVQFKVQKSRALDGFAPLTTGRDLARLGSLLFVAADTQGIAVLDASDPAHLKGKPEANPFFPYPLRVAVRGVAVDPHGRLFTTGGGDAGLPGVMRVYDPLRLDFQALAGDPENPELRGAWFMGATVISNSTTGDFNLPGGTPRKMAVLSNDEKSEWKIGDPPPSGLTVAFNPELDKADLVTLTVTGTNGKPYLPVTLRNTTAGRFVRKDASLAGNYTLSLPVRKGDKIELLRNQDCLVYTVVTGSGLAVVDGNTVYKERVLGPNRAVSDVLNFFVGGPSAGGVRMGTIVDVGLLTGDETYPLVVPTAHQFEGYVGLAAPPFAPTALKVLLTDPLIASSRVSGMEVLEDFQFDANNDGKLTDADPKNDYLLFGTVDAGVLIYDVTNRAALVRKAQIRVPGQVGSIAIDRERRKVYATGFGGGLYVVDLPIHLVDGLVDVNGDGTDDRVLETVTLTGTSRQIALAVPELGIVYTGGDGPGLKAVAAGGPRLTAVIPDRKDGGWRQIVRLAPFGVPTAKADPDDKDSLDLTGSFRVLADLPGSLGGEIRLDLVGLGPSGKAMFGAGDADRIADLPRIELKGDNGVKLVRQSSNPADPGYDTYLSEEIAVLADLRASRKYQRTEKEQDKKSCVRCDLDDAKVSDDARELLSGYTVGMRFPEKLRDKLKDLYTGLRLDAAEIEIASTPWETSPALRQEPAIGPSTGSGDAVPGTLLHSGEIRRTETDLFLKGVGFDFAFARTYRSQTVGGGPLGPGWDHVYDQRLRELPNRDLEFYDGRGRRDLFVYQKDGDEEKYVPATGFFVELKRTAAGWVMKDAPRQIRRFDRFGRLIAFADPLRVQEDNDEKGTELRFEYDVTGRLIKVYAHEREIRLGYDAEGRLERVIDSTDREVHYEYDDDGRLTAVTSPKITTGQSQFPDGLTTHYDYESPSGSLAATLNKRDNLSSITDPKGQKWLELTYTDADQDGRNDEVTSEKWGEASVGLQYTFSDGGTETAVTDRRGHRSTYNHNAAGQVVRDEDQGGFATTFEADDEGITTVETSPRGRKVTRETDPVGVDNRRARGNITRETITPGEGGDNGSGGALVTLSEHDDGEDGTNKVSVTTDARNVATRQDLDDSGLAKAIVEADGTEAQATTQFEYNDFGQPTRVTSPNGHVITYEYFSDGEKKGYLQSLTTGDGLLATHYDVDSHGNVTEVTDPSGVKHEYLYNEVGWLVEERLATTGSNDGAPALNYVTQYLYDENGNVTETRRPFGEDGSPASTTVQYDLLNQPATITTQIAGASGASSAVETREYDENQNVRKVTGPDGQVAEMTYDERNLMTERRRSGSDATSNETFQYNADRQLEVTTDGRGHAWTTTYDGYGRVKEKKDPNGNVTRVQYDANGNATVTESFDSRDVLLARTTTTYDELNRPKSQRNGTASHEAISTRSYDAVGNLKSSTDPLGRTTAYQYDAAERLTEITDPAGNHVLHTLDNAGNTTTLTTNEVGAVSATVVETARFDALSRMIEAHDGAGNTTVYAYDAHGNLLREIDPEGHLTVHTWDSQDHETSLTRPGGISLSRTYDATGRLTSLKDALGNTTSWSYDGLDRMTGVTYPDGTSESYRHDAAGNVTSYTDPRGVTVTQEYDSGNRLIQRTIGLAPGVEGPAVETFGYDGLNRMTSGNSGGNLTVFHYDTLSRLADESINGRQVLYDYDDAGSLTGMTYPSGAHVSITPDALGRPASIRDGSGSVTYGYRGQSLIAQKTLGSILGTVTFDAARRPTVVSFTAGSRQVYGEEIVWSPRSLKTKVTRPDLNGAGMSYQHDPAGRVIEAARVHADSPAEGRHGRLFGLPDSFHFTFDAADNLLSRTSGQDCETDQVGLPLDGSGRNRPTSMGGEALEWDAAGNLIRKGALHLTYDYQNRLVRVTGPTGQIASYDYDVSGRRIQRRVGGTEFATAWSGWQPIEEYKNGRLWSRRTYGMGLDEIVNLQMDLDGDGTLESEYLPFYDQAGNLVLVTDHDGRPIERYEYSPSGKQWIFVDSTPPRVEQVRVVGGEVWMELSEETDLESLRSAIGRGFTLSNQNGPVAFTLDQPVTQGHEAGRRLILHLQSPDDLQANQTVQLRIAPGLLKDLFDNRDEAGFAADFSWPPAARLVKDETPPRVTQVCVQTGGKLALTFSEEPDLSRLMSVIQVDGAAVTWELSADRYTLVSTETLAAGDHTLTLSSEPLDLAGLGLSSPFIRIFTVDSPAAGKLVYEAPLPGQTDASTIGNLFGFHGLQHDPETGFYYARHRYYDPELGRFISTDPMGYEDGPNPYQYALNNPVDYGDPMGLLTGRQIWRFTKKMAITAGVGLAIAAAAGAVVAAGIVSAPVVAGTLIVVGVVSATVAAVERYDKAKDLGEKNPDIGEAVALGVGDVLGVTQGVEAYTGIEFQTGRALSGDERADKGGTAAGSLIAVLFSGKAYRAGGGLGAAFNFSDVAEAAMKGFTEGLAEGIADLVPDFEIPVPSTAMVPYDPEFAAQQILGRPPYTPGGRTITPHAAERMMTPPPGRAPMTMEEVDAVLDKGTKIRKVSPHPLGDTVTVQHPGLPGKPQVVVDAATGRRVVTVVKNKK